jgi:acyl-CoA reductase-like NAD-dependent aldehyde dehydrogenase
MAPSDSPLASDIDRLRAAVTDDRAENSTYKQTELHNLHGVLRARAGVICAAIAQDRQCSAAEVETEFFLAMAAIRHFYESIDFAKELKEEYLVTTGVDNVSRRVGIGLVAIRPTTYTRFYSVISPLAAAIAAGNCILLEVSPRTPSLIYHPDGLQQLEDTGVEITRLKLDEVLKEVLPAALDSETFCITGTRLKDSDLASCTLVDQRGTSASAAQKLSSSEARTVAIVDRSADIDAAARAIVTARFSFQGMSSYAPDLVIVNEFVKKDFFQACTLYVSQ